MAWTTGTCSSYRDLLAQIVAFATANGWTTMRSTTTFSWNAITDEREVVLRGDCGAATLPHVGFRTFTEAGSVQGILLAGFTGHSGAAFGSLPNASPTTSPSATAGTYIPVLSGGGSFWLSATPRRICGVYKAAGAPTAYLSFYAGLLNPFRTEVEDPFPFFLGSSCAVSTQAPNSTGANVTGIVEAASPNGVSGPCFWFRSDDATWKEAKNSENAVAHRDYVLYPFGKPKLFQAGDAKEIVSDGVLILQSSIIPLDRTTPTRKLYPSPGDESPLWPVVLIATPDGTGSSSDYAVGELDGVYWLSGVKDNGSNRAAEDTITIGGTTYRVFQNGAQTDSHQFWCLAQA